MYYFQIINLFQLNALFFKHTKKIFICVTILKVLHNNMNSILYLSIFLLFIIETFSKEYIVPPATQVGKAPYASWAHHHWVWLSHFQESQESLQQLVSDYQKYQIPVGAVNIDSGWSTGFNNFIWDTKKFPNARQFISDMHNQTIRVIAWVTSMVNIDSSNYKEGLEKGYYLNDGKTAKWWHGVGSFIDYTNPEAVDWWHKAMDNVLDDGLDGWKCDGTDPYVLEFILIYGKKGYITERTYADLYYRDFLYHTREKRGSDALIMARPVDSFEFNILKKIDLYFKFAPHDTMFSGWVGDQDPDFEGLKQALRNMFHSAWNNYANYGSDIGGYRSYKGEDPLGKKLGRTKSLFIRWTQMAAFTSLMENGGDNEHRPWMFDQAYGTNDTLEIYRTFVHIHLELLPYLLNAGTEAYNKGLPVLKPQSDYTLFTPSTYNYKLWNDIFVSPIIEDQLQQYQISFPKGDDWVDWWNETKIYQGGTKLDVYDCPLSKYPVFKRKGSIIPLNITSPYTTHGDSTFSGYQTLLLTYPSKELGKVSCNIRPDINSFANHGIEASYQWSSNGNLELSISAHDMKQEAKNFMILIRGIKIDTNNVRILKQISLNNIQPLKYNLINRVSQTNEMQKRNNDTFWVGFNELSKINEIRIRLLDTIQGSKISIEGVSSL